MKITSEMFCIWIIRVFSQIRVDCDKESLLQIKVSVLNICEQIIKRKIRELKNSL